MFIDSTTLKRVNIYAPFGGFSKLDTPEIRERAGVIEIADPQPPADYDPDLYYRTEQDDAPYVVFTRKSDEQIKQIKNAKIWAAVDALEKSSGHCRQFREFVLEQPSDKPYKPKVQETEDAVAALKAQLLP